MPGPTLVVLIPARGGSKRVPGKNLRVLGGHPLLAWSIAAARSSGVAESILVSTDDPATAAAARHYGADVPFLRPSAYAGDTSPDIEWVAHLLAHLAAAGRRWDAFSIQRPTSPFRSPAAIRHAWERFAARPDVDSLRAIELCRQHPGKMWVLEGDLMRPLLPGAPPGRPWHSTPYQALPPVYVQNASLEMAWTRVVTETGTIAGERILPFVTTGYDGFDINDPDDWWLAEDLLHRGAVALPSLPEPPWAT